MISLRGENVSGDQPVASGSDFTASFVNENDKNHNNGDDESMIYETLSSNRSSDLRYDEPLP